VRPATILFVNHTGTLSGAEQSLLLHLQFLDRKKFIPILTTPGGELATAALALGVKVVPLDMARLQRPNSPKTFFETMQALWRGQKSLTLVLNQVRPDLIHFNSLQSFAQGCFPPHRRRIPVVFQGRDLKGPGGLFALVRCWADRILCVSRVLKEKHFQGLEKALVIPNGFDPAVFSGAGERAESDVPRIGCAAQMAPVKELERLLEAAAILSQQGISFHLEFVGQEFPEATCYVRSLREQAATLGLEKQITWQGWISPEAMPAWYRSLCCLALPGQHEAFGRVLMEAGACGVPGVGILGSGAEEILMDGETGFLVLPTATALADALEKLLLDRSLRDRFSIRLQEEIPRRFHQTALTRQIESVYTALLEKSKNG